jgi:hypothetical protein
MKPSHSAALGGYAAVMTLGAVWLALGAASPPAPTRFAEIDVERINVREPDGTLRLAISNRARIPGIVIAGREYPHPNRAEAGMIFYNDEGTENGGLVFDGALKDGRPTNGGSLTFDRWHQDQTIQMTSTEDGPEREAAVKVNDRPDQPLDFANATALRAMPPGPARDVAYAKAGFAGVQRAYLGRTKTGDSQLVLRDGAGRSRLELAVTPAGAAQIRFRDASGRTTRTVDAAP